MQRQLRRSPLAAQKVCCMLVHELYYVGCMYHVYYVHCETLTLTCALFWPLPAKAEGAKPIKAEFDAVRWQYHCCSRLHFIKYTLVATRKQDAGLICQSNNTRVALCMFRLICCTEPWQQRKQHLCRLCLCCLFVQSVQ